MGREYMAVWKECAPPNPHNLIALPRLATTICSVFVFHRAVGALVK